MHALTGPVERLMRSVAAEIILPRFQRLKSDQIEEKTPGELVTVADREAEAHLTDGLLAILADARVLGEEASAVDPAGIGNLGRGVIWIVDPLDGTANFAAGHGPFAVMVALAIDGAAEAAWILDPVSGRFCATARGQGSTVDGVPVRARSTGGPVPTAAVAMHFLSPERRQDVAERAAGRMELVAIPRCAGEQYPRVVLGQNDVAVFERTLPWDHIPGSLFLQEAGGTVARPDGSAYRLDRPGTGLIAAASPELWELTAEILFR